MRRILSLNANRGFFDVRGRGWSVALRHAGKNYWWRHLSSPGGTTGEWMPTEDSMIKLLRYTQGSNVMREWLPCVG